ncbi:unnamed protein product [marine sediment metagenome]|uniref:Uncharacterized protein n=1 Tax=marine sediment metagenome TaxID=412755 RepID=X1SEP0_9ZZZZ
MPGIACLDFKITSDEIDLVVLNSLGRDIEVTGITAGNCNQSFNQELNNGDKSEFVLSGCNNGEIGAQFKEDLIVEYITKDSSFSKTITGIISGKVQ